MLGPVMISRICDSSSRYRSLGTNRSPLSSSSFSITGMAAAGNQQFAAVWRTRGLPGASVSVNSGRRNSARGEAREVHQHVELRDGCGGLAQARSLLRQSDSRISPKSRRSISCDALFGDQNLALVFLQLAVR